MLPLSGVSIVVTRTREQASILVDKLVASGATPVEVPLIAIAPPLDNGLALRSALAAIDRYDWLVVTSTNGVDAVIAALDGRRLDSVRVAAIGPSTAERLRSIGIEPALVPERFVGEGLLDVFPEPPSDHDARVLIAQAADARDVLVSGLRARGWAVDSVVAYRTVAAAVDHHARELVAQADAVTFTSPSTVHRFVDAFGPALVPHIVACIGPITADAARSRGIEVTITADPHTVDGLVDALVAYAQSTGSAS